MVEMKRGVAISGEDVAETTHDLATLINMVSKRWAKAGKMQEGRLVTLAALARLSADSFYFNGVTGVDLADAAVIFFSHLNESLVATHALAHPTCDDPENCRGTLVFEDLKAMFETLLDYAKDLSADMDGFDAKMAEIADRALEEASKAAAEGTDPNDEPTDPGFIRRKPEDLN